MPSYKPRIFVTGASGLLGKTVVKRLLSLGYPTHIVLRPQSLLPFKPQPHLFVHRGDMTDQASLTKALNKIDTVIHLAADKYHPHNSYQVNVVGAANLKAAMIKNKIKRLINISTQATKIARQGVYGITKNLSDQILHDPSCFAVTTLKPSLIYGDDSQSLFQTIAAFIERLPFVPIFGNGKWRLYPIWVEDVAQAITNCLDKPQTINQIYDLGCKTNISMNALVDEIALCLNKKSRKLHIPVICGLIGAKLLRLFMDNPPVTIDNVLGSTQTTYCQPQKAIRILKLKPLTVKQGIRKYFSASVNQAIKVAIIGMGKMGLLHAAILNNLPQVKLVAFIDKDPHLRKTAKSLKLAPVYDSLQALNSKIKIDAIFICTPTYTHYQLARMCLKKNYHLFIEKPTTVNYQQTCRLQKLTSHYPHLKIAIGYYYLYRPLYKRVKTLLSQKVIGRPISFSATVYHSEVFGPKQGWLFDPKKSGGGVLINPAPHLFSLLYDYFGQPQTVFCTTKKLFSQAVEDEAWVKLNYHHKLSGQVHASWSKKNFPVLTNTIKIKGTKGSLTITSSSIKLNGKIIFNQDKSAQYHNTIDLNPQQGAAGYFLQDQAFINSLLTSQTLSNDLSIALKIEKIINACYQSAKSKNKIKIK